MHIAYHLGAHCTDEGLLAEHLWQNRALLAQEGCHVLPADALDAALQAALTGKSRAARDIALPQDAARAVISQPNLMGPAYEDGENILYPQSIARVNALLSLFPDHEASLHLALRHPATLLGRMASKAAASLQNLSWFDLIAAIRKSHPTLPITLWRDEDSPYLWDHILGQLTGLALDPRPDENRRLARIMQPAGFSRLTGYLAANSSLDEGQRRQVTAAFLTKFAQPDVVEQDISLLGWSQTQVAEMDRSYLEDVARLRSLPLVSVLGL